MTIKPYLLFTLSFFISLSSMAVVKISKPLDKQCPELAARLQKAGFKESAKLPEIDPALYAAVMQNVIDAAKQAKAPLEYEPNYKVTKLHKTDDFWKSEENKKVYGEWLQRYKELSRLGLVLEGDEVFLFPPLEKIPANVALIVPYGDSSKPVGALMYAKDGSFVAYNILVKPEDPYQLAAFTLVRPKNCEPDNLEMSWGGAKRAICEKIPASKDLRQELIEKQKAAIKNKFYVSSCQQTLKQLARQIVDPYFQNLTNERQEAVSRIVNELHYCDNNRRYFKDIFAQLQKQCFIIYGDPANDVAI